MSPDFWWGAFAGAFAAAALIAAAGWAAHVSALRALAADRAFPPRQGGR